MFLVLLVDRSIQVPINWRSMKYKFKYVPVWMDEMRRSDGKVRYSNGIGNTGKLRQGGVNSNMNPGHELVYLCTRHNNTIV
jgi:hypothetical protein